MFRFLNLSHITYAYPGSSVTILDGVNASFASGWTGIIGPNGCGKTTIARIACGDMSPDSGTVLPKISGLYCPQDPLWEPASLYDFACDYSPEALAIRHSLCIDNDMLWRYSQLSCGEQKKIQVAVALWAQPEILVVDEPTNHVDANCRKEICRAMAAYRGIGILVSHDRELLDSLVYQVLDFRDGHVIMRSGGYTQACDQMELEREGLIHRQVVAKKQLRKLENEQRRRRELADKSSGMRSKRKLDKHDSDSRDKIGLAIVSGKDGKAGKLADRMDTRVKSARQSLSTMRVTKRYEGDVWLNAHPSKRHVVLKTREQIIPCGPEAELLVPKLFIANTDHIGICGPNGAGKSTLIRHMLSQSEQTGSLWCAEIDGIRTLYIGQEIGSDDAKRFLESVEALPELEKGLVLKGLSRLGSNPKRVLTLSATSPGELRKLAIVRGMLLSPQLIVLDEPTNHLDIQAIEALERALSSFPAALILVSHDERFLAKCVSKRLILERMGNKITINEARFANNDE